MTENPLRLADAFEQQAAACAALGSPFMAQLCRVLGLNLTPDRPLTRRLFDWPGDVGPSAQSLPLRLAGALHALKLAGDSDLTAAYPPHSVTDDQLWRVLDRTLTRHATAIDAFINSPPQTNEVRRSAALIAAGHWLAARHPLPFVFSELGASAGLNLMWDHFALQTPTGTLGPATPVLTLSPDWRGNPAPAAQPLQVAARTGVDLNPLDAADPAHQARLLAYLWPDQPHRQTLTQAAIACAPPQPQRADAIDWLTPRLAPMPGHLHLIWSTIAWQYFPAERQETGRALIEAAGAKATADAPLAWLSYEADGTKPGAALTLRLWPGNLTLPLGRADFHGRWIDWHAPAENA